jgi:hypothetical protein
MDERDADRIARDVHGSWARLLHHLGPTADVIFDQVDIGLSNDGRAVAFRDGRDGTAYMVRPADDGIEAAWRYRAGDDGVEDFAMFRDGKLIGSGRPGPGAGPPADPTTN